MLCPADSIHGLIERTQTSHSTVELNTPAVKSGCCEDKLNAILSRSCGAKQRLSLQIHEMTEKVCSKIIFATLRVRLGPPRRSV